MRDVRVGIAMKGLEMGIQCSDILYNIVGIQCNTHLLVLYL